MNFYLIGGMAICLAICGIPLIAWAFEDEKKSENEKGDNENDF